MAQPTLGIYRLISQLNSNYVIDVMNSSAETNAKIWLYGNNGTSAQKFLLKKGYSDNDSFRRMIFQCSGRAAYVPKGENPGDNSLVRQYPPNEGTDDLDWSFTQDTSKSLTINGVDYNPYEITYRYKNTLRLDNSGSRVTASNDIVVYTDNNTDAQRWVLMKDSFINTSWPIPKMSISSSVVKKDASESKVLSLSGGNNYQTRYRYRTLNHNTNMWSSWSYWQDFDDSVEDEGWGDAWSSNSTSSNIVKLEAANSSPTLSTDAHDSVNYQFESRQFGSFKPTHWGTSQIAHSNSNTLNIITKQNMDISIGNVSITANGLTIEYTTDAYRTVDRLQIKISPIYQNKTVLFRGGTYTIQNCSSGNISIPFEELEYMPEKGSSAYITIKFAPFSDYIAGKTISKSAVINYTGGDLTPVISLTQINDYTVSFTISEKDGKAYNEESASFIYEHDGKAVIHKLTKIDGRYVLATPLNKKYHIFVMLGQKSGATYLHWGAKYQEYMSPLCKSVVINTINTEVEFNVFKSDSDFVTKDKEVKTETASLEGYQFQTVYYSSVQNSKLSISGLAFSEDEKPYIESALNDGYCLLRDFRGLYCYCAITNVNYVPVNRKYTSAQVDFIEIQNEIDYALPY